MYTLKIPACTNSKYQHVLTQNTSMYKLKIPTCTHSKYQHVQTQNTNMYTLKIMAHTVSSLAMLSHTVAITNSRVARYVCDDNTFNIKDTYMFRDQTCL